MLEKLKFLEDTRAIQLLPLYCCRWIYPCMQGILNLLK